MEEMERRKSALLCQTTMQLCLVNPKAYCAKTIITCSLIKVRKIVLQRKKTGAYWNTNYRSQISLNMEGYIQDY
jgi:hypothetical protein